MAISLQKTLQGTTYPDLYALTTIQYASAILVAVQMVVYESQGHLSDGFVAIISRYENITDSATVATVYANYLTNYAVAVAAIEEYLVDNVAWYEGGTVG